VLELERSGADLIELGCRSPIRWRRPTIQLSSRGRLRRDHVGGDPRPGTQVTAGNPGADRVDGYFNPIFIYGAERFAADAAAAGVDGLLVVDLPPRGSRAEGGHRRARRGPYLPADADSDRSRWRRFPDWGAASSTMSPLPGSLAHGVHWLTRWPPGG